VTCRGKFTGSTRKRQKNGRRNLNIGEDVNRARPYKVKKEKESIKEGRQAKGKGSIPGGPNGGKVEGVGRGREPGGKGVVKHRLFCGETDGSREGR